MRNSELFWSAFSRIRTEQGEILRVSLYSVRIRENADQNNSEYGHFLRMIAAWAAEVLKMQIEMIARNDRGKSKLRTLATFTNNYKKTYKTLQ